MKVSVIKVKEGQVLAEWTDEHQSSHRAWFPLEAVNANNEVEEPDRGLEYGDDFAELIGKLPTKKDVVQALHNQGLWVFSDLSVNPAKVHTALALAFAPIVSSLLVPLKED